MAKKINHVPIEEYYKLLIINNLIVLYITGCGSAINFAKFVPVSLIISLSCYDHNCKCESLTKSHKTRPNCHWLPNSNMKQINSSCLTPLIILTQIHSLLHPKILIYDSDHNIVNSTSNKDALLLFLAMSGGLGEAAKDLLENKLRNYTMCSTILVPSPSHQCHSYPHHRKCWKTCSQ